LVFRARILEESTFHRASKPTRGPQSFFNAGNTLQFFCVNSLYAGNVQHPKRVAAIDDHTGERQNAKKPKTVEPHTHSAQLRRSPDGLEWEPDPLIMDERFVAVAVKGKGLVVFTACSHAGVVNVLTHAREVLPSFTLHGVVGGLHLAGASERLIPKMYRF
jgi:metal-dependent hydrolase (beta-lactamase superfamily II)